MKPHRILIIRLSSLGDILHTLPAFQSLRLSFPHAEIDWLVERRMQFLVDAVPGIHRIVSVDTRALSRAPWRPGRWAAACGALKTLRERRYDLVLDFQGLLKTALFALLSGGRHRIGFGSRLVRERPADWFYDTAVERPAGTLHIIELNRLLAAAAGAECVVPPPELRVSSADRESVRQLVDREKLSEFIIINPGGGWATKRWHPDRYADLCDRIHMLGLRVIVTTGPDEEELYEAIRQNCKCPPCHVKLGFLQLIPLMQRSLLLVGGDTGPLHLACAVGTPIVGIFGPTSPARNGPWSSQDGAVVRQLHCSFCHKRRCPTQNECMDISVDEVFGAVVRRLSELK